MLNAAQMARYRAQRAKGDSPRSSYHIARGEYDGKFIPLKWNGYDSAEVQVDGFTVSVKIEPDYDVIIADHEDGEFSDTPAYRLLPWAGKRKHSRRFVLASALTKGEIAYRKRNHEPSDRSARNNGWVRDPWSPWYTDYGITGSPAKDGSSRVTHDLMDYYWRHGYSKSDAYFKATQAQREAAKYASSGTVEYYDLHITVTRVSDGAEVKESWRGGFDVDGCKPWHEAFNYVKSEAEVFVFDTLYEIEHAILQRYHVAQPALF